SLRTRFEEANYSWEDPLSAQSFSAWRAKLPEAQDDVVQHRGNDGTSYEIRTRTEVGPLAEASLRLRASDLRAIEGSFRFRDNEVVDTAEAPGASPDLTFFPEPAAEVAANSSRPNATVVGETVTAGDELHVRVALRRIDADLGEPIEVERNNSDNVIVVTA